MLRGHLPGLKQLKILIALVDSS